MDWIQAVAILGTLASITGLAGLVIQTYRQRAAEHAYAELRRRRKTEIWGNIALALGAFDRLEPLKDSPEALASLPDDVKLRIIAVRQCLIDQYLRLLEQAAFAEDTFDLTTVETWYKNGRLQNEWRRQAALNLVPTEELQSGATPTGTSVATATDGNSAPTPEPST